VHQRPSYGLEPRFLADRKCALKERPRAREIALGPKQAGQRGQASGNIGVVRPKRLLANREGAAEVAPRPRKLTVSFMQARDVIQPPRRFRMRMAAC
jgi:hypothetical protein